MSYTIEEVGEKLIRAEQCLNEMCTDELDTAVFRSRLNAFVEAAGHVPAMLRDLEEVPDNAEWYRAHMSRLQGEQVGAFFISLRENQIVGAEPGVEKRSQDGITRHYFTSADVDAAMRMPDAVTASREYLIRLLVIVYDCYVDFGIRLDPQQYFTKEEYPGDIEQAEVEVYGWERQSLIEEGLDEDARWSELRSDVGKCEINHLFYSYLGKPTPQPVEPEEYADFAFTPEDKGWTHVPAGFGSIHDYVNYVRERKLLDYPDPDDLD